MLKDFFMLFFMLIPSVLGSGEINTDLKQTKGKKAVTQYNLCVLFFSVAVCCVSCFYFISNYIMEQNQARRVKRTRKGF